MSTIESQLVDIVNVHMFCCCEHTRALWLVFFDHDNQIHWDSYYFKGSKYLPNSEHLFWSPPTGFLYLPNFSFANLFYRMHKNKYMIIWIKFTNFSSSQEDMDTQKTPVYSVALRKNYILDEHVNWYSIL